MERFRRSRRSFGWICGTLRVAWYRVLNKEDTEKEHREHGQEERSTHGEPGWRRPYPLGCGGGCGGGVGGGVGGVTDRDAADDGEGFSSGDVAGAGGEFTGGAADGRDCAAGIFDGGKRDGLAVAGARVGAAAGMARGAAKLRGGMVRGDGARKLPDTWSAGLGDGIVFYVRSDCGGVFANRKRQMEVDKEGGDCGGRDGNGGDCDVSLPSASGARKAGSGRVGRGARRFDPGDFAEGEHAADRRRRAVRGNSRPRGGTGTGSGRGGGVGVFVVARDSEAGRSGADARAPGPYWGISGGVGEFSRGTVMAGT